MRIPLLWKLLGIHALVIGMVILVVWLAIDYLAADYFMTLMKDYNISPTASHQMFLEAAHRYLIWATVATLFLAAVLSLLLTKRVLRPLSQMAGTAGKIAAGDYTDRVQTVSRDEIGQLAKAFNRMADSLHRIEQLRKKMVIDVAHELRTPLTNMRGYLEALRDSVLSPSRETFESLHEETLRLVKLVEDLLRLARADSARATLHAEEISLRKLIAQSLNLFRAQLDAKGIVVEARFDEGLDRARGDPDKLAQAIGNLLQNACQYTPDGGAVRVTAEQIGKSVKLTFGNTGEGIAAEDLPFIFERFYRAEKSRSREHGGAGIGLAIVRELIEAHGGEVGAESSGAETRIWFTLPV